MVAFVFFLFSCVDRSRENKTHAFTNALINETSPYLLQHAHNPVEWYPWGDKAFQKAADEKKLVIVSIGYSACHWCHVMEQETFEDTSVARFMNEHFVCVKVDREERPDVDRIYMSAVNILTGNGGWPLNALALADGRPFFAGTYFTSENWMQVLKYFVDLKANEPGTLTKQAEQLVHGIKNLEHLPEVNGENINGDDFIKMFSGWKDDIDYINGGHYGKPKFPMPVNWELMLNYHYRTGDKDALKAVTVTLDHMMTGGIFDQLGGGFCRYTTDEKWMVPHFEKMLYDNAQLVSLYCHAWQVTGNPLYRECVEKTLDFIDQDLKNQGKGYFSSVNADSEGEEGKYYVWNYSHVTQVLGNDAALFCEYFGVTPEGNWENGSNILYVSADINSLTEKYRTSRDEIHKRIGAASKKLLQERLKRNSPQIDNKVITSWNAMLVKAHLDAYKAFGHKKYMDDAAQLVKFIIEERIDNDNRVYRIRNDVTVIPGLLDDYANTISALISFYQVDFNEQWLYKADSLAKYVVSRFGSPDSPFCYYSPGGDANLFWNSSETEDGVIPSSNSVMAENLFALGTFFYNESYLQHAQKMVSALYPGVLDYPRYYSNWGLVAMQLSESPYEIAVVGDNYKGVLQDLQKHYLPNAYFLGGNNEGTLLLLDGKQMDGSTNIFVCRDKTCRLPVKTAGEALSQMRR